MNPARKKQRIAYFESIKKDIIYYETESRRWENLLEEQEFDIPAQRKKLKKYSKLLVNAKFFGYARLISVPEGNFS